MGGVVGGILGLAVVAAAIWFFLRRRKSQRSKAAVQEPFLTATPGPAVAYMHEVDGVGRPSEKFGNEIAKPAYEMDSRQAPSQGHGPYEI